MIYIFVPYGIPVTCICIFIWMFNIFCDQRAGIWSNIIWFLFSRRTWRTLVFRFIESHVSRNIYSSTLDINANEIFLLSLHRKISREARLLFGCNFFLNFTPFVTFSKHVRIVCIKWRYLSRSVYDHKGERHDPLSFDILW